MASGCEALEGMYVVWSPPYLSAEPVAPLLDDAAGKLKASAPELKPACMHERKNHQHQRQAH